MAKTLRSTIHQVATYLQGRRPIRRVSIGEPKSKPDDWHAALMLGPASVVSTTLGHTIEVRNLVVRVYVNMLSADEEETEMLLDEIYAELKEDWLGDFDLGDSAIRAITPLEITAEPGYLEVDRVMYRITDITLPMTVDGSAAFVK